MKSKSMDKIAFVDFDDTLFFTFPCVSKYVKEVFGKEMTKEEVKKLPRKQKMKMYVESFTKYWEIAKPNEELLRFLEQMKREGYKIVILTARGKELLGITKKLLEIYQIKYDLFFYRENTDIKDEIWKLNIIKKILLRYSKVVVFDDKLENIKFLLDNLEDFKDKLELYLVEGDKIVSVVDKE